MGNRSHLQKQASSQSTFTPVTNPFQPRPFAPPTEISPQQQETPDLQAKEEKPQGFGYNLAKISITNRNGVGQLPIQTKLTIGQPGDKYEQEADRVAAQVVNQINAPVAQRSLWLSGQSLQPSPYTQIESRLNIPPLQRRVEVQTVQRHSTGEEEELKMKPLPGFIQRHGTGEEEELKMKPCLQRATDGSFEASSEVESQLQGSNSGGSHLPNEVRSFMEPRFGQSFEHVRVHTDTTAVQLNRDLHAQAFTKGNHIYYGVGKSPSNLELTAHELTHTIQQTGGAKLQRQSEAGTCSAGCGCQSCNPVSPTIQRQTAFAQSAGIQDLLSRKLSDRVLNSDSQIQCQSESSFHGSDCKCSMCAGGSKIQTKLKVGAPGDTYEQEADRVAAEVMRMPNPASERPREELAQTKPLSTIQRYGGDADNHVCTPACYHTIQRQISITPVAVQQSTPNVIQRHAAYEHYLLGQVEPSKLANIPFVRQIPELEKREADIQKLIDKKKAKPDLMPEALALDKTLKDAKIKKEEVRHTLDQEMQRLLIFKDNPEALGGKPTGKVEQAKDGKWQVPYVSLPVKGADGKTGSESIVVTYSEINTFPDFFGNPETIANTPKQSVLNLLQGVRQQSYIKLTDLYKELFGVEKNVLHNKVLVDDDFQGAVGPRGQAVVESAYEKRTELQVQNATTRGKGEKSEEYFAALERNACHFAPYSWESWEKYHKEARSLAQQAGEDRKYIRNHEKFLKDSGKQATTKEQKEIAQREKKAGEIGNKALLQNAFGEHYLQDSFAAGHLIDKTKIMQWFTQWLNASGKALGSTDNAKSQWAMASMVANQDLKSNPQALDDRMHKGNIHSVGDASSEVGMGVKPEIEFMMWWRNAANINNDNKHLTPDQAAAKCPLPTVKQNQAKAKELMESLVSLNFAKIKTDSTLLVFNRKQVYSLDEAQVDVLKGKGAYQANLGQKLNEDGKHDFAKEAQEFNVAAYNMFFSNAYIQAATKYFHDKFCKDGLNVISGNGFNLGRIYGDNNMINPGAQRGVQFSAETSQMSREAIFNIMDGKPDLAKPVSEIKNRFPAKVHDKDLGIVSIAKWNEDLKAKGDAGLWEKATDSGAKAVYKIKDGISGGNAIDVSKLTMSEFQKHDAGAF